MQTQIKKKKKNQNPPWEDLNPFILSMIFARLSLQDQLFCPAYVCRAWFSASLFTLFQNSVLDLRVIDKLEDEKQRSRFAHLLKFAIDRCGGWVTIYFPSKYVFGYFATAYIAEKTPNVSSVFWSSDLSLRVLPICISLLYWKKLRVFHARLNPEEGFAVLSQLADYCEDLIELGVHGKLTERDVLCVTESFPRIKALDLSESSLSSKALGILLDGKLKNLKELNILHCLILDDEGKDIRDGHYCLLRAWRKEMLGKASNLKNLKKLMHCLEVCCEQCKDVLSKYNNDLEK
ncbi:F-box/LRR-repeat protein [Melia azedarach]|uniref:F-box/LRR-repeat protein n=1 Tax=Melia azedarach TaxID=155640 RepID=A0ACC1YUV8_MELAZ|nr:F-box/LRR-repeat protein [Melia azedarach]